jgi:quercetin dioxygenase-like cupin family protein
VGGDFAVNETNDNPVTSELLLRTSAWWDGTTYPAYTGDVPEVSVVRFSMEQHAELSWHRHPIPSAAYIISGSIRIEKKDGTVREFTAGNVIAETVNLIHRGLAGAEPVTIVTFYAGSPGATLSRHQGHYAGA